MKNWNERDGAVFGRNQEHLGIEHGAGSTHPRAKHGSVRGCLMLSVVSGMFRGLSLSQSADGEDTEDK
ncbi:MAG: hypothetical protein NDI90_07475 [Nitrospira sp. BO4]|nr:hypothetical protein [Nitrospira sp. BO4]